ncbi:MAG: flagellar assembly protein FliH [Methylococcaceae bacterium]|nr:MAG: flagellar assembly protein FliH [Methylococcaceae bacterium]
MSISRGFSPEELQALSPWQLPDISATQPAHSRREAEPPRARTADASIADKPPAPVTPPSPPAPTAEEIEAIQKQAYAEGFARGYQEGQEKGYMEGKQKGYDEGYQQGNQEGHAEGLAEGRKQGQEELAELQRHYAERFQQLWAALSAPLAELDDEVEHELLLLAVAIAKQVVRRELKLDPGQIVATAKAAAAALPSAARDITLHLHPEDGELLKEALSLTEQGVQWKILEDPLITHGGCRITSESSAVDATVEKRLAQAIAKVLGDERVH